jgi:hypothetical protein
MTANSVRDGSTTERRLHPAHLLALRAAPYVLWAAAAYLILVGTLVSEAESGVVTSQVLGSMLAIAGTVVTRAEELDVKKDGLRAKLQSIRDLDRDIVVSVKPGVEAPVKVRGEDPETRTTVSQLLEAARAAGWTVGWPNDGSRVALSGPVTRQGAARGQFVRGDFIEVSFPYDGPVDPVPQRVIATLEAAGFVMP